MAVHSMPEQTDGKKGEEGSLNISSKFTGQSPLNVVDRDKLLFSVFSLLQKLGSDERPEVL